MKIKDNFYWVQWSLCLLFLILTIFTVILAIISHRHEVFISTGFAFIGLFALYGLGWLEDGDILWFIHFKHTGVYKQNEFIIRMHKEVSNKVGLTPTLKLEKANELIKQYGSKKLVRCEGEIMKTEYNVCYKCGRMIYRSKVSGRTWLHIALIDHRAVPRVGKVKAK